MIQPLGVKNERRECTSRTQDSPPESVNSERRSPAFYATRRDVGWLVAALTVLDSLVKLGVALVESA